MSDQSDTKYIRTMARTALRKRRTALEQGGLSPAEVMSIEQDIERYEELERGMTRIIELSEGQA
jgi:hypothetical protein